MQNRILSNLADSYQSHKTGHTCEKSQFLEYFKSEK